MLVAQFLLWFGIGHTKHVIRNAPRDKTCGLVLVAVPRKCFTHTNVWLDGRKLKRGTWDRPGDFYPTESGIVPGKTIYEEWRKPQAKIRVEF